MPAATGEVIIRLEPSKRSAADAFPALRASFDFLATNLWKLLLTSALVLVPCFWHRHIQATDLGSHVYNAWLAQLIAQGAAPGLRIVPQHSNVLFDLMLAGLIKPLGPVAAERIAVAIAVLIFFWGGFALCSAAAQKPAWPIAPLLAVTCYGFMFNMGFFNLYLSVGFSLFALTLIWRGKRWDFLLLIPLVALIWMSHLLGSGGLITLGALLLLFRAVPLRWQLAATIASIGIYSLGLWYLLHHFIILPRETDLYWLGGTDQFVVYNSQYEWVAVAALTAVAIFLAVAFLRDHDQARQRSAPWLQVYAILAIAVFFAPGGIYHPKLQMMGYLPDRASLYTAIFLCALVASVRPAKWQGGLLAVIAIAFFALLYRDTAALNQLEAKVDNVVSKLSPGDRVVANLFPFRNSRIHEEHVSDRACIYHCFFVANYEPASDQFRIKAAPGNRIVAWTQEDAGAMKVGRYLVQPNDTPLLEVYQCGPELEQVCMRELQPGEYNGEPAYRELDSYIRKKRGQISR